MIDVVGGISNPITESAIVAGLGVVALAFKRWRTGAVLIVLAAIWLWLCATPTFALLMWQGLANRYPPKPPADYPRADAIVLVGGGAVPRNLATWNATTDPAMRLNETRRTYSHALTAQWKKQGPRGTTPAKWSASQPPAATVCPGLC